MLSAGSRLGPFEIVGVVGKGGMGQVFKARDTRLGRLVAIKILAEEHSERFKREARAIAALNHPNICTLYEVGPDYLVMELIDGKPISGPVPWPRAVGYAREILDALDEAHRHGVIHRDLKPANLLLTQSGIKLLDFGLAKHPQGTKQAIEETASASLTGDHVAVGTPKYMAPEQVEAREVDERTDIFAFGCVMYELLTGKPAFGGGSIQGVLASVLSSDPTPIGELRPDIPEPVVRIVQLCLEKQPDRRWQRARDIGHALQLAQTRGTQHSYWKSRLAFGAGALALTAAAIYFARPTGESSGTRVLNIAPPPSARSITEAVISPDGARLALVADRRLWIRPLDTGVSFPVERSFDASYPFWAPNSKSIAFFSEGSLKRVGVEGGEPHVITPVVGSSGGAWKQMAGSEDVIVFSEGNFGLRKVSATGGEAVALTKLEPGQTGHHTPQFLPDGKLLYGSSGPGGGVFLADYDRGGVTNATAVLRKRVEAAWFVQPLGFRRPLLLFYRGGLMAQPFDAERRRVEGEEFPVSAAVMPSAEGASFSGTGIATFYTRQIRLRTPVVLDRGGKVMGQIGESGAFINLRLAPDGKRLMVTQSGPERQLDLYLYDLERKTSTRITDNPAADGVPVWSPDGNSVAFASWRDGVSNLYLTSLNGSRGERPLLQSSAAKYPCDWSRDGKYILFETGHAETGWDLEVAELDAAGNTTVKPYLTSRFNEHEGRFSPDGKWVAYTSNEDGRDQVYVQSFPTGGGRLRISPDGGGKPVWRPDGLELYYMDPDGGINAVPITWHPSFQPGKPTRLLLSGATAAGFHAQYDVSHSGDRFVALVIQSAQPALPVIVLNWKPVP